MKLCTGCGETKDEDMFPRKGNKRASKCKECKKKYNKVHYELNKEYYIDKKNRYKRENPEWYAIQLQKNRNNKPRTRIKETKICITCGSEFELVVHNQKTCSIECRKKEYNRYMRQYHQIVYKEKRLIIISAKKRKIPIPDEDTKQHISWCRKQKCFYCGKDGGTHDHVIPISRGGDNHWSNIVPACSKCNGTKQDKTPEEWALTPSFPCGIMD